MRLLLCAFLLAAAGAATAKTRVGDPAPHYVVRLLDGTQIDSAALAGKVVLVNRWATWCGPCRQEMPAIDAYFRRHAADGLRVYAVTVDDTAPPSKLKPLAAMLAFPLARSISGGLPVLDGVPTSYVIDRRGIVRYARADAFDEGSLDAVVGRLLAETAP